MAFYVEFAETKSKPSHLFFSGENSKNKKETTSLFLSLLCVSSFLVAPQGIPFWSVTVVTRIIIVIIPLRNFPKKRYRLACLYFLSFSGVAVLFFS